MKKDMTMTETKREVFLLSVELGFAAIDNAVGPGGYLPHPDRDKQEQDMYDRYDAALPDHVATVPAVVSEYLLRKKKAAQEELMLPQMYLVWLDIHHNIDKEGAPDVEAENWVIDHSDAFARAWLDEVWIEEESGKVVRV